MDDHTWFQKIISGTLILIGETLNLIGEVTQKIQMLHRVSCLLEKIWFTIDCLSEGTQCDSSLSDRNYSVSNVMEQPRNSLTN